jgi:alpha-beta hydrolase superfamily lysophospholipase
MPFIAETLNSPTGATLRLYAAPITTGARAVVQINHGLAEHAARYARFAEFLNARGFYVYAHDHRGHGSTTAPDAPPRMFASEAGAAKVVLDVEAVHDHIANTHPGLPVISFGHSMGGLIALNHAMRFPQRAKALAVWNANFSAGLLGRVAQLILRFERARLGHDAASQILPKLTFQAWAKSVKNRKTDFDWLSRDEAEVAAYVADPLCGWDESVAMWQDVFALIFAGADDNNLRKLPKHLPVNLLGGGADPATDGGKAVTALAKRMRAIGMSDVNGRIDPDMRHESLNEINRQHVMEDFAAWALRAIDTARITGDRTT